MTDKPKCIRCGIELKELPQKIKEGPGAGIKTYVCPECGKMDFFMDKKTVEVLRGKKKPVCADCGREGWRIEKKTGIIRCGSCLEIYADNNDVKPDDFEDLEA